MLKVITAVSCACVTIEMASMQPVAAEDVPQQLVGTWLAEDIGGEQPPIATAERAELCPSLQRSRLGVAQTGALTALLRQTMAHHAGVERDAKGLGRALAILTAIERVAAGNVRLIAMTRAARFIVGASLMRAESRGAQYRTDFPLPSPTLAHRSHFTLAEIEAVSRGASAATATQASAFVARRLGASHRSSPRAKDARP